MFKRALIVTLLLAAAAWGWVEIDLEVAWQTQVGTEGHDRPAGIVVDDDGNVYVAGNSGEAMFLKKFDANGNEIWTELFGVDIRGYISSIDVDATGDVYICGGILSARHDPPAGRSDAFVSRFNRDGHQLWTRQYGSDERDSANAVAAGPGGAVYVVGTTDGAFGETSAGRSDAYLCRLSADGEVVWHRQVGTSVYDKGLGVDTDGEGNVYITIETNRYPDPICPCQDRRGPSRSYLMKFDEDGNDLWIRKCPTERAVDVAADAEGSAYILGPTESDAGDQDVLLAKFDGDGNVKWTSAFGTAGREYGRSVATGPAGVYIVGSVRGHRDERYAVGVGIFICLYGPESTMLWRTQLPGRPFEGRPCVASDKKGNAYVAGSTRLSIAGPNAGMTDLFLVRYNLPQPTP